MRSLWIGLAGLIFSSVACADNYPDIVPLDGWDNLKPAVAKKGDWPWWRGPNRDNVSPVGVKPPAVWSANSSILWKLSLPGLGHSSPVLCGNRLYITSGDRKKGVVNLLCLEQDRGKEIWNAEVYKGTIAKMHRDNSLASSTPAFDGDRIFVPYQTANTIGLAAVSPEGKLLWRTVLAPYATIQGYSASPVFYKSLVILPIEAKMASRMVAVHRATGKIVWRSTMRKVKESYASALVAHVAGRDQLLLTGGESTRSYDPSNGTLLWECMGPSTYNGATPAVDKDTVYVTGGYPEKALMAIRADGKGDVTKSHLRWQSDKKAGYVPSPTYYNGLIYAVNDQGHVRCYDAVDGKVLWEKSLKQKFYSSPVIVNELIYLFDRKGNCTILKTGRKFDIVSKNTLPFGVFASPVFKGQRMYLRTLGDLYCIGE